MKKSLAQRLLGNILKPALLYMSSGRLPQVDGRITVEGLQAEVTVGRDHDGIPHLQAKNRHDLFFAQGFVHAQDRLWQMELNRRVASGRLSEMLGSPGLETDRLVRTLGFHRLADGAWRNTSEQVQQDALAYTAGVNAYLDSSPQLPVEFSLLRHKPDPWQVTDSLTFGRMMSWLMSHGWSGELARAQLYERFGLQLASELEPRYPDTNPVILPDGIEFNRLELDGMLKAAAGPYLGRSAEGSGRGSNSWVIGPQRSATGHTILANDVHLPIPSLWYYMHLQSDDGYHVTGVSLPGVPYIQIGHNEHIAWGITLAFTDCEDLFIEKFDPERPTFYQFKDTWREADVYEERIAVKGRPDHIEKVLATHHGPIITSIVETNGQALALRSVPLTTCEAFDGFPQLNQAHNWNEFVNAVREIETPTLNIVYADREDNIGYYVSGLVPIREKGSGLLPQPGWTGEHEWQEYVPFEEMPHALNPEEGYIITANNKIVNDDYPHYLGSVWMNGFRAKRLEQLITAQEKVSPEDCRRFQMDFLSIPGLEMVKRFEGLETADPDAALSLKLLLEWDGRLETNSVGGAVYQVLLARLTAVILLPHLGPELTQTLLGEGVNEVLSPITEFYGYWHETLLRLLDNPNSAWIPGGKIGRDALLIRCLVQTTAELRRLLGENHTAWQWGQLHQITFNHVMGVQPPLDMIFNQGPYPIGGDTNTVTQTAIAPGGSYEHTAVTVAYRQVVDFSDLSNSFAMYAPGQSGHPGSPHYGNFIERWLKGEYFKMVWMDEERTAVVRHMLRLGG
jgi:penicillin amidase